MKPFVLSLLHIGLIISPLWAQKIDFRYDSSTVLQINQQILPNAWAGGLNSVQIGKMDLNHDQWEDLVVFDRTGNKINTFLTFRNQNLVEFKYAPYYEQFFPEVFGWFILADYDQDGKKDIFTHANLGVKVYRNTTMPAQSPSWQKTYEPLMTEGYNGKLNLQIGVLDIPAIVDLDDDGDLDILTFDFGQGSFIELHQNQSQELYKNASQLEFKRVSRCWGGVMEGMECGDFSFGNDCEKGRGGGELPARVMHIGSTLKVLDLNGDKQKDLLIGDVSCNQIFRMWNKGTNKKPKFNEFDTFFPENKPIAMAIFPALFWEDLDFDDKPDLLASPNVFTNVRNLNDLPNIIDFEQSLWFYRNIGSLKKPNFQFQQSNFLQNTMLDLGENAHPAWSDLDEDGDMDLFVGHRGRFKGQGFVGNIYFFKNVGNTQKPQFVLENADYQGVSKLELTDIRPFFYDLNQDGKPELLFTGNTDRRTDLYYSKNGQWQIYPLPLFNRDFPCFYDLDRDGDDDMLIGRGRGGLAYFENKGSKQNPDFQLINDSLGGLKTNAFRRDLTLQLADIDQNGQVDLLTGDSSGKLRVYGNFIANWTKPIFQPDYTLPYHFGSNVLPAAADLNGDQLPDIMVGNNAGGLQIWLNQYQSDATDMVKIRRAGKFIYLLAPLKLKVELYQKSSQKLFIKSFIAANLETPFQIDDLPADTYEFRFVDDTGRVYIQKIDF
ncbi:MAG: VCBS repeat-containing protein [Microscillaceae bacterium]|jgi:hypothetical protein|nr:VCBS repeat-containing protein [Microscillaceae bacterium]